MVNNAFSENVYALRGLSTDVKPIEDIGNGSIFYCMDTGERYMLDKSSNTWILQPSGGGGGSGRAEWGFIQGTLSSQTDLVNFVNSTVGTNTANYIYKTNAQGNKVPFDSLEELEAYTGTVTNNDYAFVKSTDASGNLLYTRYKYSEENEEWAEEYTLNNSSFTSAQWAAMNSGITAEATLRIASTILGVQINGTDLTPDENWKVNIPFAAQSDAGVIKASSSYGFGMTNGNLFASEKTYAQYSSANNNMAVGKGTLENVFTAKHLADTDYIGFTCEMSDGTTKTLKMYCELV